MTPSQTKPSDPDVSRSHLASPTRHQSDSKEHTTVPHPLTPDPHVEHTSQVRNDSSCLYKEYGRGCALFCCIYRPSVGSLMTSGEYVNVQYLRNNQSAYPQGYYPPGFMLQYGKESGGPVSQHSDRTDMSTNANWSCRQDFGCCVRVPPSSLANQTDPNSAPPRTSSPASIDEPTLYVPCTCRKRDDLSASQCFLRNTCGRPEAPYDEWCYSAAICRCDKSKRCCACCRHNSCVRGCLGHLRRLVVEWSCCIDRDARIVMAHQPHWMHVSKMGLFLNTVAGPMGHAEAPLTGSLLIREIRSLDVSQYKGYVHYADLVVAIIKSKYDHDARRIPAQNHQLIAAKQLIFSNYADLNKIRGKNFSAASAFAAFIIRKRLKIAVQKFRQKREQETRTKAMLLLADAAEEIEEQAHGQEVAKAEEGMPNQTQRTYILSSRTSNPLVQETPNQMSTPGVPSEN